MSTQTLYELLDAAIKEYIAVFSSDWKPRTLTKYKAEFRDFPASFQSPMPLGRSFRGVRSPRRQAAPRP